ncbi:MAG: DNA polymerase III subunit delta [Spirochaetaceae bacterium]|nr:MAG: DNA polymerase III subunit delta [Spirochaetaceae bacterium]
MSNQSCYLFLGPETGEKDNVIADLIKKLEQKHGGKPEVYKYYGFETKSTDVIQLLQNKLLFADHKVVIISNLERMGKTDLKDLAEYCRNPGSCSTLILCSDETSSPDIQIERAINPANKKIFWELLEHQKKGFILNYCKKTGRSIDEDAVLLIMDVVENNTREVQAICERLDFFFPGDREIQYVDIENFLYHGKEENIYTLFTVLVGREFGHAVEICHKILLSQGEDHLRIINGLLWQFRTLLNLQILAKDGCGYDDAFGRLKIKSKRRQKAFIEGQRNYSTDAIFKIIRLIAQYDVNFRTFSQATHLILLELFIYKLVKTV